MRFQFGTTLSAICVLVAAISCNHAQSPVASASPSGENVKTVSTAGNRVIQEVRKGRGIACRDYGEPVSMTGDFSYLVSDIGRPGVPQPNKSDMQMINRIRKYVYSKDLRFEYLAGKFIVYDATRGPCETAAPGYRVLNSQSCNVYYSPTDDFDSAKAVPDSYCTPGPWITNTNR